jgi:hypothetical protein
MIVSETLYPGERATELQAVAHQYVIDRVAGVTARPLRAFCRAIGLMPRQGSR